MTNDALMASLRLILPRNYMRIVLARLTGYLVVSILSAATFLIYISAKSDVSEIKFLGSFVLSVIVGVLVVELMDLALHGERRLPIARAYAPLTLGRQTEETKAIGTYLQAIEALIKDEARRWVWVLQPVAPMHHIGGSTGADEFHREIVFVRQVELAEHQYSMEEIERHRGYLKVFAKDVAPKWWASVQNNLGTLLVRQAEQTGNVRYLAEAIEAYREALGVFNKAEAPQPWALVQKNLGDALLRHGEVTGDARDLAEAIEVYRKALEVFTKDEAPKLYAFVQKSFGDAHLRQGTATGDNWRLAEAIEAYRQALEALRQP